MSNKSQIKSYLQLLAESQQKLTEIKEYEDVDAYLKDLQTKVLNNTETQEELQTIDYDIWFTKKSRQSNLANAKKQVTSSLYIKNIDKVAERKDLVKLLLPFFNED